MNPFRILSTAMMAVIFVWFTTACTEEPVPEQKASKKKPTLLCEGSEGITPFTLRCEYFYLDESNNQVVPEDTVNWTLDIALEGIAQRFYSQSTGNNFFTEIDRSGEYTLTASNNGNKASVPVLITEPATALTGITRQVSVTISSDKHEVHERILEASPGYEITNANIQVHPNSTRVSSQIMVAGDRTSAKLIVELQPKEDRFKGVRAWFAGNIILTEHRIINPQ